MHGFILATVIGVATAALTFLYLNSQSYEHQRESTYEDDRRRRRQQQQQQPNSSRNDTIRQRNERIAHMREELENETLHCPICLDIIKLQDEVYSCCSCKIVFHWACSRQWARESNNPSVWECPTCKKPNTINFATSSHCFCGQTKTPIMIPGTTPHCCRRLCLKCNRPCHPGPC